jgi:DNA polymerase I
MLTELIPDTERHGDFLDTRDRASKPMAYGRELLRLHWETYPAVWRWSDGAESYSMLLNRLRAVFGWTVRVGPDANPRSLRNFPRQANGAVH